MPTLTAKDKFYLPLRRVAKDYLPMLLARMRVLEQRATKAMEYLEDEADERHELVWEFDDAERISSVAEAQTDLHKSVLEAGTCQQLVGAFIELLQDDYLKIRDSGCFYMGPDGKLHSLYDVQNTPPSTSESDNEDDDEEGVKSR
jgi:hypothetical protein